MDGYEQGFLADAVVTQDGIVAVGKSYARDNTQVGYLVKLSLNGSIQWRVKHHNQFLAAAPLSNGDVIAVGWKDDGRLDRQGDLWMGRYGGANGAKKWGREWSMGDSEDLIHAGELADVVVTNSGDVLAVGTGFTGAVDSPLIGEKRGGIVIRVTPNGTEQWYREYPEGLGGITRKLNESGYVATRLNKHAVVGQDSIVHLNDRGAVTDRWVLDGNRKQGFVAKPRVTAQGVHVARKDGVVAVVDGNASVVWRAHVRGTPTALAVTDNENASTVVAAKEKYIRDKRLVWFNASGERVATGPTFEDIRDIKPYQDSLIVVARGENSWQVARIPDTPPVVRASTTARLVAAPGNRSNLVTVNVSNSSARSGISKYKWDFNANGTTDAVTTNPVVSHRFDQQGRPRVRVTVVSNAGIERARVIETAVVDTLAPTPGLAVPQTRLVAAGRDARLNASSSTDNIDVIEYRWDFDNDGSIDAVTTNPATTHRYDGVNQTHTLSLMVVDAAGNQNTTTFKIQSVENDVPNASLPPGIFVDDEPAVLVLDVQNDVGEIDRVTWVFPNGSRVTTNGSQPVEYTFNETGDHQLTVLIEDEYGAVGRSNMTVNVRDTYPPHTHGAGLVVIFFIVVVGGGVLVLGGVAVVAYWVVQRHRHQQP